MATRQLRIESLRSLSRVIHGGFRCGGAFAAPFSSLISKPRHFDLDLHTTSEPKRILRAGHRHTSERKLCSRASITDSEARKIILTAREKAEVLSKTPGLYWSSFQEVTFVLNDEHGQPLSGIALRDRGNELDECVDSLLAGAGFPMAAAVELAKHSECGMTNALAAIAMIFTQTGSGLDMEELGKYTRKVASALEGAVDNPCNERHMRAIMAMTEGNLPTAASYWEQCLLGNPLDALALFCVKETYFMLGDSKAALASIERVMGSWTVSVPGYSRVVGMHSEAMFENGFISTGEESSGRALTISEDNVVAIRAACRGFYATTRHREGRRLLSELKEVYSDENDGSPTTFMSAELIAFRAIFDIEPGKFGNVMFFLDEHIYRSPQANFLHAANVLWRLRLAGVGDSYLLFELEKARAKSSQGLFARMFNASGESTTPDEMPPGFRSFQDRYKDLVQFLPPIDAKSFRPMLDLYSVIVLCESGMLEEAVSRIERMKSSADLEESESKKFTPVLTFTSAERNLGVIRKEVIIPVCEAIIALSKGDPAVAVEYLLDSRPKWSSLIGNVVDVDLLEQTLLFALMKAAKVPTDLINETNLVAAGKLKISSLQDMAEVHGQKEIIYLWLARALASERTSRLPNSPKSWEWFSRIYSCLGDENASARAALRAIDLGYQQGGRDIH